MSKVSAGVIALSKEGKILWVESAKKGGFPFGSHEPGETIIETAFREAKEETGGTFYPYHYSYHGKLQQPHIYINMAGAETYLFPSFVSGNIRKMEDHVSPIWVDLDHLLLPTNRYPKYNKVIYDLLLDGIDFFFKKKDNSKYSHLNLLMFWDSVFQVGLKGRENINISLFI